jgi:hypothetical protein
LACASSVDVQAFVLEETLLLGDGQRHHVGELDETEFEVFLFQIGGLDDSAQQQRHDTQHESGFPGNDTACAGGLIGCGMVSFHRDYL